MKNRTQILLLSLLTFFLAIAATGLGIYTFRKETKTQTDYLAELRNTEPVSPVNTERESESGEASNATKDINLTEEAFSSVIGVLKAKGDNPDMGSEEIKNFLDRKIDSVPTFSYSFTKENIKTSSRKNTKQDIENYFNEVYSVIPKETFFSGTIQVDMLDGLSPEERDKKLDIYINDGTKAFEIMLKKEAPRETIGVHEIYLKLVDSEISFLKALKKIDTDPVLVQKTTLDIQKEVTGLQGQLQEELQRLAKTYGIEFK